MKTQAPTPVILVEGAPSNKAFVAKVRARVADTLARVDPSPTGAKIIFADDNGPKGGPGIRCTIVHDMPRRRDFSVSELGSTYEVAFDAAYAALESSVTRDRKRRRVLVRRPKKYFLAKRLLESENALDAPVAPAEVPTKRVRRLLGADCFRRDRGIDEAGVRMAGADEATGQQDLLQALVTRLVEPRVRHPRPLRAIPLEDARE